jgi:hypothetical protein
MFQRILFIALCFIISMMEVAAQKNKRVDTDTLSELMVFTNRALGFTPSALLNVFSGIQLSSDHKLSDVNNINMQYGLLLRSNNRTFASTATNNTSMTIQGFRLRASIEHMMARSKNIALLGSAFINYRYTKRYSETQIQRANFNFVEIVDITNIKHAVGPGLGMFLLMKLGDTSFAKFGGGLGYPYIHRSSKQSRPIEQTEAIIFNTDRDFFDNSGIREFTFFIHFNVSFAF